MVKTVTHYSKCIKPLSYIMQLNLYNYIIICTPVSSFTIEEKPYKNVQSLEAKLLNVLY